MSPSANLPVRIRGAMLGLAVSDALGAPVEFKQRGSFPRVTEMMPNKTFGTSEGAFTDDTSMALCLAHSLLDNEGKHNGVDQVEKYLAWRSEGYMSSIGECFDIGASTRACLSRWQSYLTIEGNRQQPGSPAAEAAFFGIQEKIRGEFNKEEFCGNGSLMRIVPVALIAPSISKAEDLAVQSSMTTHPHPRCTSACAVYTKLVHLATQSENDPFDKTSLAIIFGNWVRDPASSLEQILQSRLLPYRTAAEWNAKPIHEIRSSGYVVDSMEAALWAFFTTSSFEQGAIKAVNLGDDADTVGAIYGGLAGAFYGADDIPKRWVEKMKRMDLIDDVVAKIIKYRNTSE